MSEFEETEETAGVRKRRPGLSPEAAVLRLVVVFYAGMGAAGIALAWWRRDSLANDPFFFSWEKWPLYLAVALGLALAVHLATRAAMGIFPAVRRSGEDIRSFLGDLRPWQVAVVALASGVGEELLFRGWLLNEIGLWWSSLLFGLIHVPPSRQWMYWPVFAMVMGLLLGWLFLWTSSLLYPVLLHAGINFLNIRMAMPPAVSAADGRLRR